MTRDRTGGTARRGDGGRGSLAEVQQVAGEEGLRLRRAWPRGGGHLLLDLVSAGGTAVAGQWLAEPGRSAVVAAASGAGAWHAGRVVLQPGGADRRLPVLRELVARPGALLAAHRPERRGVVRGGDGTWTKVVRPGRSPALEQAARGCAVPGVRVPLVLDADHDRATVTTAALPGRPLHELLRDPATAPARLVDAARATGEALASLHAAPVPDGAARHDGAAELGVVQGWVDAARGHRVLAGEPDLAGLRRALAPAPGRLVPLHRDLHDKQVLVDDDGGIGLLDFDLAAAGEAALDVANLLEHLRLRARQGRCARSLAETCVAAVLEGYRPDPQVRRRLPAYTAATRLRLLAVYAFRPGQQRAAADLLAEPLPHGRGQG